MTQHDVLMMALWPVATAILNAAVMLAGQSDKPWAKLLARVGTALLAEKK